MKSKRITLFGATSYTGLIIAEKLRSRNVKYAIAGRNTGKLMALRNHFGIDLKIIEVDIMDYRQVDFMLDMTDILINCVGPYNLYGASVLEKSAEHGLIYLDITGEQEFVKNSFEKIDLIARRSGATIIHSLSFESCLADVLANRILDKKRYYQDISSYYYFENFRPSPGTKLSMKMNKYYPQYLFNNFKYEIALPLKQIKKVSFDELPKHSVALFMPFPEVIFFSKKYDVKNSGSYLLMTENEAMMAMSKPDNNNVSIKYVLEKHNMSNNSGPSQKDRNLQSFILVLNAIENNNSESNIMLKGIDMYGITANLIVNGIEYLSELKKLQVGVLTPSEIMDNKNFLDHIIVENKLKLRENVFFHQI